MLATILEWIGVGIAAFISLAVFIGGLMYQHERDKPWKLKEL